jgi:hypothetical protein
MPAGERARFRTSKRWSAEDDATLKRLRAENKTVSQIAKEMGRVRSSVYNKLEYANKFGRTAHFETVVRTKVPPEREADRDRRMAADRDITSMLCGDPAPGQSALDKMNRSQQRAVA